MDEWREADDIRYDNIDDDQDGDRRFLRIAVWTLSAFVVLIMVGLPVLRAIELGDDDDPEAAARDARAFVAERFAESALERRSTRLAARWTLPELREQVDDVVGYLQVQPEAVLDGTEAFAARAGCAPGTRPSRECFHVWLRRPGGPEVVRMWIMVGIEDGEATVVALERIAPLPIAWRATSA
jgi:hypothetical protein